MRFEPLGEHARGGALGPHRQKQVRPVERAHEDARAAKEQALDDVGARRRVGGRRHRDRLRAAERLRRLAQTHVFGAEVVAPLRDAVGFVDGEEIDRSLFQHRQRVLARQPFGRDVEQAQRAIA